MQQNRTKESKNNEHAYTFFGYHKLLVAKQKAGRPKDLADINKLKKEIT